MQQYIRAEIIEHLPRYENHEMVKVRILAGGVDGFMINTRADHLITAKELCSIYGYDLDALKEMADHLREAGINPEKLRQMNNDYAGIFEYAVKKARDHVEAELHAALDRMRDKYQTGGGNE